MKTKNQLKGKRIQRGGGGKFELYVAKACKGKNPNTTGSPICKEYCGEDAYFITNMDNYASFGVADGVGGWSAHGIDASAFSCGLMSAAWEASQYSSDSQDILTTAYKRLVSSGIVQAGSSTACIATFNKYNANINVSNLGDSGLVIIRADQDGDGTIIFETEDQQSAFNAPFQLAIIPPHLKNTLGNDPKDALVSNFPLLIGDIIIMASDGLWDNAFQDDIEQLVNTVMNIMVGSTPNALHLATRPNSEGVGSTMNTTLVNSIIQQIADSLLFMAKQNSESRNIKSPFSETARLFGKHHSGGKIDDITIIVGAVTSSEMKKF